MKKVTGKEALMEILLKEEVEYVFGIPGATEIPFMAALEKYPEIKYILGLQEVVAAGMAEGYTRVSDKPGFLNLHTGTGLGAALPMLLNARKGNVPLVVTAGQQDKRLLTKDPHLAGGPYRHSKPFCKMACGDLQCRGNSSGLSARIQNGHAAANRSGVYLFAPKCPGSGAGLRICSRHPSI